MFEISVLLLLLSLPTFIVFIFIAGTFYAYRRIKELEGKLGMATNTLKFYADSQCFVDSSGLRWECNYYNNSKAKKALSKLSGEI